MKDYHEKKYDGGEEKVNDQVEVAKDGLGLILERWDKSGLNHVCLFVPSVFLAHLFSGIYCKTFILDWD